MERLNGIKQKAEEQLQQLQSSCLSASGIISKTMNQTNSYRLQKFSETLNALSSEIRNFCSKKEECEVAALPSRMTRCKFQLVSIITSVINTLVDMAEEGANIKLMNSTATSLENVLNGLGVSLFEMPVGEAYDFTIDGFFANVKGETHSKEQTKGTKKMYIESSTFGCAEQKASDFGRVIEKANVTLTDEPTKGKKSVLKLK